MSEEKKTKAQSWANRLAITNGVIHAATLTAAAFGVDSPLLYIGAPALSFATGSGAMYSYLKGDFFSIKNWNTASIIFLSGTLNSLINVISYRIGEYIHDPSQGLQLNQPNSPLVEMISTYAHDGLSKLEKLKTPLQTLYMKSAQLAPYLKI